jgi:hypothetical protein
MSRQLLLQLLLLSWSAPGWHVCAGQGLSRQLPPWCVLARGGWGGVVVQSVCEQALVLGCG